MKFMLTLFSDGGARGNPGPAASAWLVFAADGKLQDFGGKYLGETTNNRAEYEAIFLALSKLSKKETAAAKQKLEISCHLDSELVVKQLRGEYKIKDAELKKISTKVQTLLLEFKSVKFQHVARAENHLADQLVNLILDSRN